MEETTEGILLQTIPYLGNTRILKVFTQKSGLETFLAKGVNKKSWTLFTTPFCLAEWVVRPSKSEMATLIDASLLDSLSELKNDYTVLFFAGQIAKSLLSFQLPKKKSAELYTLLYAYFKKLSLFEDPEVLVASFQLKILLWEGLLSLQPLCSLCSKEAAFLEKGESLCSLHATFNRSHSFTKEEWDTLFLLAYGKKFSLLQESRLSTEIKKKISELFNDIKRLM